MGAFTKETFVQKLEAQGIVLSTKQLQQFETYAKLLAQWNEKINLTAIVEENEVYEKHFYDSILPFLHMDMQCLCDVGAGAGFPSIPVKLCAQLSLTGVHCLHVRAEDHAKEHRECFDVVSARAVAALPVLSELCLPLGKVGGRFIAMKGPGANEEIEAAKHAVKVLGAEMEKREESRLSDGAVRINVFYRKQRPTDRRYPRNFGQIKKHPL